MSDLNQCQFIGRLGKDPETKFLPSGDAVTNISIACGWKGKDKEGTEWVPVVFFGRLAEVVAEYLRKGSQIYVQGRYQTRSWEKDGQKHYRTEIVGERMQMLGSKKDNASGGSSSSTVSSASSAPPADNSAPPGDFDDDLPF